MYKTNLHVLCTPVPEEFLDQNVVFFLRNTKGIFLAHACVIVGVCVYVPVCVGEILNFYPFLRISIFISTVSPHYSSIPYLKTYLLTQDYS